jgi:glycopeptide antibiotics resistance protein
MITNFLLDHSTLIPVTMAVIAVVCVVVGYLLLRARPRCGHRVLWTLVGLSLLPVAALTLLPTLGRSFVFCVIQFSMPTLRSVELLANVALFFPPVFFATLATRKPLLTLATGTALSAAIEIIQGLLPAIGRSCDTNDWAMNTAGATVAAILASATMAFTRRKRPAEASDHA